MAFSSVHEMIDLCKESGKPLYEVILESDLAESGLTRAESEAEMHRLWAVMQATSDGYCGADRSMSGFAGGDAAKVNAAAARGVRYADGYFADVMAEALKTAECNACMKRIVAAPTAGSCGVLPAVLLPLQRRGLAVAARATRGGAEGGCQAEVGAASGMAAAALVDIKGGTAEQCAEAFAMALTNLEGLVCDPVAGLVEVPCVKRNVIGAVNAVSAADMALAGIESRIPVDEVIDAMGEVGRRMPVEFRETALGGLAATPTGERLKRELTAKREKKRTAKRRTLPCNICSSALRSGSSHFLSFAIRAGSNRKRERRTAAQSIRIGTSCPDIG